MLVEIKTIRTKKQLKSIFDNLTEDEELALYVVYEGGLYKPISFRKAGEHFIIDIRNVIEKFKRTKEEAIDLAWYWVKELKVNKYAIEELPPKPKLVE